MGWITRTADKTGAFGSIVSAMGCAACFPAIASFGAAIGLGFLQQYEGLFISTLLPLFATAGYGYMGFRLAGQSPLWAGRLRTSGQTRLTASSVAETKKGILT